MFELLHTLSGTPIPTILVVAGILFLLLSLSGGLSGKLFIPAARQRLAGVTGAAMLAIGILIYVSSGSVPDNGMMPPDTGIVADDSDPGRPEPITSSEVDDWPVVGTDTFFDDTSQWQRDDWDNAGGTHQLRVMGGVFRWEAHFKKSWWQSRYSPYDPVTDFYAATDINFKSRDYNGDLAAGMVFRTSYNRMYQLLLLPTKYIQLKFYDKQNADNDKVLIDWIYLGSMDISTSNRIAVLAQDTSIKVYFNGNLAGQVDDDSQGFGNVGYILYNYADEGLSAEVEFDNFELKVPPG